MKIVIVIPTYNSIKYIDQCMNSALLQDYSNFEVHAYDNGSTDGTLEFLYNALECNDNLYVHEVPNIYKNSYREAVDHAFQNLDTDYITFLASDDYLDQSYISKCMKIISYDPQKIKCIQSGISGVNAHGDPAQNQIYYYKNLEEFKRECMKRQPVNSPAMIYHKELYRFMNWTPYGGPAHKANDILEGGAGDYDMFCGFADNDIFIYPVNQCLGYYYRWHEDQCTWDIIKQKQEGVMNYEKIIQDFWREKWNL